MAKKHRYDSGVILVLLIVATIAISGGIIAAVNSVDRVTAALDEQDNLLVLVTLGEGDALLSSQLLAYNVRTKRAALIDLPPYLGVIIEENNSLDRIDTLYSRGTFGKYQDGVENLIDDTVDFSLRFDTSELSDLIDLLRGIRLFVLEDPSGNQQLPSGDVIYDGEKVVEYVNAYTSVDNEEQIADALQTLMVRVLLTIADQAKYITDQKVSRYFLRYVDSNLNGRDLENFLLRFNSIEDELIATWKTQGDLRGVLVENQRELLLFPHNNGAWIQTALDQINGIISEGLDVQLGNQNIRIEILNGTTVSGLARRTELLFEQYGYVVVGIGNHVESGVAETLIINRSQSTNYSSSIGRLINTANLTDEPLTENPMAIDVTIILGEDFDGITVK